MSIETNEIMNNIPDEATEAVTEIADTVASTENISTIKVVAGLGLAAAGTIIVWEKVVKPVGKKAFDGGRKQLARWARKHTRPKHTYKASEEVEVDLEPNLDNVPGIEK